MMSNSHLVLVPRLIEQCAKVGRPDMIINVGGIIPQHDYPFLEQAGVKAVFGPGTQIPKAARRVLRLVADAGAKSATAAVGA